MKPRANNPGLFVGGKQCSLIAIEDNLNFLTEPDVGCWHLASFAALQQFVRYWGNDGHAERVLANLKGENLRRLFRSARTVQRVTDKKKCNGTGAAIRWQRCANWRHFADAIRTG
jgi:hypothetical protein